MSTNQVTLLAVGGSVLVGAGVVWAGRFEAFFILPGWVFIRMALNAVDGMLAREFGQKSTLGVYLNELGDVVADAALVAPFAMVVSFSPAWVFAVILLSTLSEYVGVMGPLAGACRRYDGALGKSDRALVFGALALWVGLAAPLPLWAAWIMPCLAGLLAVTVINRVRSGAAEAAGNEDPR